jgi:hypothetical protein
MLFGDADPTLVPELSDLVLRWVDQIADDREA